MARPHALPRPLPFSSLFPFSFLFSLHFPFRFPCFLFPSASASASACISFCLSILIQVCNTLSKDLDKRHSEQNATCCLCLQAIPDGSGSDAEAAPLAPRPTPASHPTISSNLHLSKGLAPFEPPPLAALTDDVLAGCLKTAFGYGAFRGQQLEVVRRVLDGHSTLAVLPTGGLPQQLRILSSGLWACPVMSCHEAWGAVGALLYTWPADHCAMGCQCCCRYTLEPAGKRNIAMYFASCSAQNKGCQPFSVLNAQQKVLLRQQWPFTYGKRHMSAAPSGEMQ